MPEPILLALGLFAAGVFVLSPLRPRAAAPPVGTGDDHDAAVIRHRVALEALRDVEVDRHAGSLDDAAYSEQLIDAEARAVTTRAVLDDGRSSVSAASPSRWAPVVGLAVAAIIGLGLVFGSTLPATGLANATVRNEQLDAAQDAEITRQARVSALLDEVEADPRDPRALSDLADAYLAGSSAEDLIRAAVALRVLIDLEPERADAYERIITAYLRASDYANARAALSSYTLISTPDPAEAAFFEGLIALRGEDDPEAARDAFDRFLELAPDDPRAAMVRGLRAEVPLGP